MEIYVTQRLDTSTLMTLFYISQGTLRPFVFHFGCIQRMQVRYNTDIELGMCYVTCLFKSLGKVVSLLNQAPRRDGV